MTDDPALPSLQISLIDQLVFFAFHQPGIALLVHRALGLDDLLALGPEVKLARIAGVILLNIEHRFIHYTKGQLRRDRVPFIIACGDGESPWLTRLVLGLTRFDVHGQKILRRRHDHLFCVHENLAVVNQHGAQKDIRHVLLFDRQLDQLHRAVQVD